MEAGPSPLQGEGARMKHPLMQAAAGQQQQAGGGSDGKEQAQPVMHHGGSFGNYMALKNSKLREQFEANQYQSMAKTNIFAGVGIHVNGYTQPSHAELKQLMMLHGGRFENYMYREHVTHIVCNNLPDTKLKQLQHARDPIPIVRPEWIVASIAAGRQLPIQDFLLQQVRDAPGQRKIATFKQHEVRQLTDEETFPQLAAAAAAAAAAQAGTPDAAQAGVLAAAQAGAPAAATNPVAIPTGGAGTSGALPQAVSSMSAPTAAGVAPAQPQPAWSEEEMLEAQALCARLRSECDVLKGAPKSTRDDPNFMETYFKASRLHFIGTWKVRIEALMAEMDGSGPQPVPVQAGRQAGIQQQLLGRGVQHSTVPGTPSGPTESAIVHIDLDCFFASASCVGHPILKGKPIAVAHSNSNQGTGEVSTANYEARKFGLRSGMSISEAKNLCPHLLVVPYNFEKYQSISETVYRILMQYTSCVQPLSCDEAYLDITGLGDPEQITAQIRDQIQAATECTASAGIGPNVLVARLATAKCKPNGQLRVRSHQVMEFLADLPVDELPGVGWSMRQKLHGLSITTVRQLRASSKEQLQRVLGAKTGAALWAFAHGRDDRRVEPPKARKSVGAEVNYGIRFTGPEDTDKFLADLSGEVVARMGAAGVKAKAITLKIKRKQEGAPAPWKHLGHGPCDNLSRSVTLGHFTNSVNDILRECRLLLAGMKIPPDEIRGLGITVAKLDTDAAAQSARPSAPAPTKLQAPAASTFEPRRSLGPWPSLDEITPAEAAAGVALRSPFSKPGIHALQGPSDALAASAALNASPRAAPPAAGADEQLSNAAARREASPSVYARAHWPEQPSILDALHRGSHAPAPVPGVLQQQARVEQVEPAVARPPVGSRALQRQLFVDPAAAQLESGGSGAVGQPAGRGVQAQLPQHAHQQYQDQDQQDHQQQQQQQQLRRARNQVASNRSTAEPAVLPPASQLDPDVLNALPPELRSEIEAAYRAQSTRAPAPRVPRPAATAGQKRGNRLQQVRLGQAASKRLRTDGHAGSELSGDRAGPSASIGSHPHIPQAREARPQGASLLEDQLHITASQVDLQVLSELPEDVRREVLQAMKASHALHLTTARHRGPNPAILTLKNSASGPNGKGPGDSRAGTGVRAGSASLLLGRTAAAAAAGEPEAQEEQAGDLLTQARRALFEPESWQQVCCAFQATVSSLMADTGPAGQTTRQRQGEDSTAQEGGQPALQGDSRRSQQAEKTPQLQVPKAQVPQTQLPQIQQQLAMACELLAQWALGQEASTEHMSKALAMLDALSIRYPAAAGALCKVTDMLQKHAQDMYGAKLVFLRVI